jgi:hypothetical protein
VLGKITGVYLGRPFEGWTYDQIMTHLGEINYYVHDKLDRAAALQLDDETIAQLGQIFDINRGRPLRNGKPAPEAYAW